MGKEIKGDLLGFNFNRVHSSNLGIVRIIPSNRINDNAPTHSDVVVDVPGATGSYYYGTIITKKDIEVHYAFDNVSETQLLRIKTLFSDKLPHKLVFDEEPDVYYIARVSNSAQLKHLCFLENGERVYKGEGSVTFTCDYPYKIKKKEYQLTLPSSSESNETEITIQMEGDLAIKPIFEFSSGGAEEPRKIDVGQRVADKNERFFVVNLLQNETRCYDYQKNMVFSNNSLQNFIIDRKQWEPQQCIFYFINQSGFQENIQVKIEFLESYMF